MRYIQLTLLLVVSMATYSQSPLYLAIGPQWETMGMYGTIGLVRDGDTTNVESFDYRPGMYPLPFAVVPGDTVLLDLRFGGPNGTTQFERYYTFREHPSGDRYEVLVDCNKPFAQTLVITGYTAQYFDYWNWNLSFD